MSHNAEFDLDISTHAPSRTYHIDTAFWDMFECSLLERGKLVVDVTASRAPDSIGLIFDIRGTVELTCDRSLEVFEYPIVLNKKVVFRLGYENKELDEDLYMIERETATINLAQHIYDFISLATPMKKIHPKFALADE